LHPNRYAKGRRAASDTQFLMKTPPTTPMPSPNHRTETPTPHELLNDLKTLVADTELLVTSTVSERSAEALEALQARLAVAQERFMKIYSLSREKVVAGARCTDAAIRKNPYRSVALALGGGLLVGLLLGRRGR